MCWLIWGVWGMYCKACSSIKGWGFFVALNHHTAVCSQHSGQGPTEESSRKKTLACRPSPSGCFIFSHMESISFVHNLVRCSFTPFYLPPGAEKVETSCSWCYSNIVRSTSASLCGIYPLKLYKRLICEGSVGRFAETLSLYWPYLSISQYTR